MAEFYTQLNEKLRAFIEAQHMFFTASAGPETRVNLSPKGMDTFRILDDHTVGYLDLTGSGNETSAHIKVDGRLTIMVCGFEDRCWILRMYGKGEIVLPTDTRWSEYASQFEVLPGTRQIVLLHIESVQTSCGYAVPRYEFQGHRDTLVKWSEKKGEEGIHAYQQEKNVKSIDGLPTHLAESK